MKFTTLKKSLTNNLTLKAAALIIGFSCWHIYSSRRIVDTTFEVPVCFVGDLDTTQISAPETVCVVLRGPRNSFYQFDKESMAIYIASNELHQGKNIRYAEADLFLPPDSKLINCTPTMLEITVNEKTS